MANFRNILCGDGMRPTRPLLFDGAMGTLLQARGLPPGEAPERFCLARPDVLKRIHADYLDAGADIVLTATFGGTRFKLPVSEPGMAFPDAVTFNREMARIARTAADEAASRLGRPCLVGGDMGPCGHFVRPIGELPPPELYAAYREQARGLAQGGADLFVIETQFDLAEVRLAVAAIREESDLPVMVSMTFEQGMTLTGSSPEIFAETMLNLGVDGIGVNCGAGPEQMLPLVDRLLAVTGTDAAVFAEPNAGLPELVDGKTVFRLPPLPFATQTAALVERGARAVGGCCGTTPEHIAALRQAVDAAVPASPPAVKTGSIVLTTRSSLVRIGPTEPLVLVGERINPTGKKDLQAEMAEGRHDLVLRLAAEQIALGASVLDVNSGAPLVDESLLLPDLVQLLTGRHVQPLSLDSSSPDAIAAALPWCPASSLVNSISGESGRMERLGPLCRRWGAPFILLPLRGGKLPVKAAERIAIIETLLEEAAGLGIPRRLILVDALALAVASKPEAAREGLETIRWCTAHGLPTVIGLSNISFGLPARELVNATFLGMAVGAGLAACIANPSSARLREVRATSDVLMGLDRDAARFVAAYAGWTASASPKIGTADPTTPSSLPASLEEAVLNGEREYVVALVERELEAGADPFALVRDRLIPAITEVGERYERHDYFLPQLLRSAETMQTAFARLRPLLEQRSGGMNRPRAVFATVEGDIHDIGKNIVTLLLGNHGFEIIDLGKDVRAEDIVRAAAEHKADIIGLSALMTTTMIRMKDTIRLVREKGMDVAIMVGGAAVTPAFAESIGARYSSDAVDAVRLAKSIMRERTLA